MTIFITKNGFRATEWDGSPDVRRDVDVPVRNILRHLRSACKIEDGVTLGDIIRIVAEDAPLAEIIGHLAWCDVRAFYAEVNKPAAKFSNLKWIELSSFIEIEKPFENIRGDMDLRFDVHGVDDEAPNWAIEFTPVNEMANVPVRLDPIREVHDWRDWENRPNHNLKTDEGLACFSLLEVLTEIFFEISFHGSPKDRNEKMGEVFGAIEEAKAAIESGEATLVPWEQEKETVQ